jgi:hypothetical protein
MGLQYPLAERLGGIAWTLPIAGLANCRHVSTNARAGMHTPRDAPNQSGGYDSKSHDVAYARDSPCANRMRAARAGAARRFTQTNGCPIRLPRALMPATRIAASEKHF